PRFLPSFVTGDFDGDGRKDIWLKVLTPSINTSPIPPILFGQSKWISIKFDKGGKDQLVSTITNGYDNQVKFDFESISTTAGSNVYITTGTQGLGFPVILHYKK